MALVLIGTTPAIWINAFTVTFCVGMVLLSIVVLTGYAGQLSLAQAVLAGAGALAAAWLSPHVPFIVAIVFGAAIAGVGGLLVRIPALRTRGVNLAIITLGMAFTAQSMIFNNPAFTNV